MKSLFKCKRIRRFWRDEEGANGIEYALLAALIAVAFIAGATLLGTGLNTFFNNIATCVSSMGKSCSFGGGTPPAP